MRLTITTAIHARWGHRVDGLIHSHAWTVEATVAGPVDTPKVMPVDDLEDVLSEAVADWCGHYLTDEDVGQWKGFEPLVWDREPTVEEIVRRIWIAVGAKVPGLVEIALVEAKEFDRCRMVRLAGTVDESLADHRLTTEEVS